MTDLQKLKSILDNQQERGIQSGDWDRMDDYYMSDSNKLLIINTASLSFRFTSKGRFIGISNWQE